MSRAVFVVIDGVDGCGKSTQAERLCGALAARGRPAPLHLREPGSTALGEALRDILLSRREIGLTPAVETLLFCAARRQMLDELVAPALAAGRDVVCERFHPSTFAYQAVAGGLDEQRVLELLTGWAGEPSPDVVVLLAVDPAHALERLGTRGGLAQDDRFEGRGIDFQRRVAAGLERYAQLAPGSGRVVQIAGEGSVDDVHTRVLSEVQRAL